MARFRALRPRILAAVTLVACLVITLVVAYAHVTPTHAAAASVRPCDVYTETDNIVAPSGQNSYGQPNPYYDGSHPSPTYGDTWEVYYNLRVDDTGAGVLCGMQLVLRIFPATGGNFAGPVEYFVYYPNSSGGITFANITNQTVYAAAPNHIVTRSDWFSVGHGTYTLVSVNVNYNFTEAVGVFTV